MRIASCYYNPVPAPLQPVYKLKKFACRALKGRGAKSGIRVIYSWNEEIKEVTLKTANEKPCKVVGKTILKNKKMQLNLYDGKNIITDQKVAVADTVLIDLKNKKITKVLALDKNATVLIIRGKHAGETGKVEKKNSKVEITIGKNLITLSKASVFVIENE